MTLMFFVSGLFVWRSLERKGGVSFLRDRLLRLGVPFLFGAMVIPPIAHFASYLQTSDAPTFGAYWRAWWALSDRPIGPMWFNAMLLVFDFAAVGLLAIAPKWGERIGALASRGGERPARFFAVALILSALDYVPLALAYGDGTWTQWGLFQFQTSRPVHYFVYFITGVAVGVHGLRKGLLSHDGALARRWPIWALAAAGFGALVVFLAVGTMTSKGPEQSVFVCASDLAVVPSCANSFVRPACSLHPLRAAVQPDVRQSLREQLRHLHRALCVRGVAPIRVAPRLTVGDREMGPGGHRGLRRELAFDGGSAATSGSRPHHLTKGCGKPSLLAMLTACARRSPTVPD